MIPESQLRGRDWHNLPNLITLGRLGIALLLFTMLTLEISGWGIINDRHLALNIATVAFILCVVTDFIDGFVARRRKMVTTFGRLADTFVDKIVICGTLIYLVVLTPDLIRPWFVVIIVAREFLVSGIRSYMESQGVAFPARAPNATPWLSMYERIPLTRNSRATMMTTNQGRIRSGVRTTR